jgi:hypothetical protein
VARLSLAAAPEQVSRGIRFALLAVPAGLALYLALWAIGINPGLVPLGIAFAAFWLYRRGSGGRVGRRGLAIIILISVATSLGGIIVGLVAQASSVQGFRDTHPLVTIQPEDDLWERVTIDLTSDHLWLGLTLAVTVLFAVIGCVGVWLAARSARQLHAINDVRVR